MSIDPTRRRFTLALASAGLLGGLPLATFDKVFAADDPGLTFGPPAPFSFDRLRAHAQKLATKAFRPTPVPAPKLLDQISYDVYQKVRFRMADALYHGSGHGFPVAFFHLGRYARRPVAIYTVVDNQARAVRYSPALFDYDDTGLGDKVPDDLGFSGFRVMNTDGRPGDWLAFQGASYFRSAGPLNQYGLSARGIAVDTAVVDKAEEFPRFTAFWLAEPPDQPDTIRIFALLDGPSITGAYRFDVRNDNPVQMDVHADLYQRADIEQLGIAPLTSMYWYSETNGRTGADWHPEIHDSDGLALWTGAGERLWRPLNNPPHVQTNTFADHNPKGFGLLQRDRNFDHYLDDGVYYDRRPSVWVQPVGNWGKGAVTLVEIPTHSETNDNIVAFWQPDSGTTRGASWGLDYKLYWADTEPFPPAVARVVGTRLARPGIPGQHQPRDPQARKFVVEFAGGPLASMKQRFDLEAVVTTSRGSVSNAHVLKLLGTDRWYADFDLHAPGKKPVDIRCYVRLGNRALTETWVYQFFPGNYGFRWG